MEQGQERLSAQEAGRLRAHCQHFSQLGWALFAQMAAMVLVQTAAIFVVGLAAPGLRNNTIYLWCLSTVSCYGVGFPLFCLVARGAPAAPSGARRPLGTARFLQVYLIGLSAMYLFNFATLALMWVLGALRGAPVENPVTSVDGYPTALNLLLGCVIAPLAEETMFRGLLLERLRPYGEKFAMLASALCFGLFHGNLYQFFYAFALGVILAYVALKTRCLWQTILLHAMLNFIDTGLLPLMEGLGEAGTTLLGLFVLGAILLGIVFFIAQRRELSFDPGGSGFTEGRKWGLFFQNPGVICFCILAAVLVGTYFIV